jgi:hypothetical protein
MPWTPDLADTWAQAYGLVAKVMVAAARSRQAKQIAWGGVGATQKADLAELRL